MNLGCGEPTDRPGHVEPSALSGADSASGDVLVHNVKGPRNARLSKDVMFSLRYGNDEHITN
jgi:hypothetical protein